MAALLACGQLGPAAATQRSPGWWDPDGVGSGADWHYRVPVTLPSASSVNSTAKVDIDFASLMTQLGISGTFDVNSVRVVRPGGTIAAVQEYNDTIYAGATDASATRGEVRWIVEDGGAQTYYVYFDVTANGAKSVNPQTPINGNFEHSVSGAQLPSGWASATRSNASYDLQVRPSESVSVSSDGNPGDNPANTDGSPLTGSYSYMLGSRTNSEPATGALQSNTTVLTRTFSVPATNPGSLSVNWRVEGWDAENYDNLYITVANGTTTTTVVGNALGAYTAAPTSPNIGGTVYSLLNAGYGHYNGYDMTSGGLHKNGMTVALHSERWWSKSVSLSAFAGQTVTLTIGTNSSELFRSWYHIDDIEWSVVTGALGIAEGFGVAATSPAGSMAPGQVLIIKAVVDAKPGALANPVTADVVNNAGTTVASGIKLYNDGTHGDLTANDATWTNNGSDGANPTYTIPISSGSSTGWLVRIYAYGASTSTLGSTFDGLIHRNGQPSALVMANWWNIDEQTFTVDAANIGVTKAMTIVSDGVNATNFKAIPGAQLRFCVTISNSGTATASSVAASDSLPPSLVYVPGSMLSGADCASAATVEDDDAAGGDESDPVGASYSGGTIGITRASLATSGSFAVTYRATVS